MRPSEILKLKRSAVLAAASRHHARKLSVFGSVLREEDAEDSDIDLLAEFLPMATLLDAFSLQEELDALLEHKVDLATPAGLHPSIRAAVLREARPLCATTDSRLFRNRPATCLGHRTAGDSETHSTT